MRAERPLVIGVGHPDRADDAAGRLVARKLKTVAPAGVRIVESDGEAGRLFDLLGESGRVVIVDAARSGVAAGTIHRLDAVAASMPRPMFAMSSHAIGLVESIELARTLGVLPARCLVIGIEAGSFDLGGGVSPAVAEAIDRVVDLIVDELRAEAA